jgi:hypothetical protein
MMPRRTTCTGTVTSTGSTSWPGSAPRRWPAGYARPPARCRFSMSAVGTAGIPPRCACAIPGCGRPCSTCGQCQGREADRFPGRPVRSHPLPGGRRPEYRARHGVRHGAVLQPRPPSHARPGRRAAHEDSFGARTRRVDRGDGRVTPRSDRLSAAAATLGMFMYLSSGARCYTIAQLHEWLSAAGYAKPRRIPVRRIPGLALYQAGKDHGPRPISRRRSEHP